MKSRTTCTLQMCTTRKPLLVVITSLCTACASDEIHIPYSTMAAALGTPSAVPLAVSYREVCALMLLCCFEAPTAGSVAVTVADLRRLLSEAFIRSLCHTLAAAGDPVMRRAVPAHATCIAASARAELHAAFCFTAPHASSAAPPDPLS